MAGTPETPWWKTAVFYQIYPRSFADADGDGVGDLAGISQHVDHLVDLGIDAVWLSPFYESPMRDFGYDISDHTAVDPVFGTMEQFDRLLALLHDAGIRLIVDFVPNHVSSDHAWFVEARTGPDAATHDWFIWADPAPDGGPPTNWTASFTDGGSAWTLDDASGQYYLHLFLPEQPDINWANPDAMQAQLDVMRFWLDRGVDGFRIDVVNAVGKDPDVADVDDELVGLPHVLLTHHDTAHPIIRAMRATADAAGDTMLIGEVVTGDLELQASYQGDGDELHLCVNFASVWLPWDRTAFRDLIAATEAAYPYDGPRWPSWVFSNHDNPRVRTRYGNREARVRAAAVLLLSLRGTPFVYQGDELGLSDADIPPGAQIDPGGRDGCRAPIPWVRAAPHGWGAEPWLPFSPLSGIRSVEWQQTDPLSVLQMYKRVLTFRRRSPALQLGRLELLDTPPEVLGYRRQHADDILDVFVNFTDEPVDLPYRGTICAVSDGVGLLDPHRGVLRREQAVILRPDP